MKRSIGLHKVLLSSLTALLSAYAVGCGAGSDTSDMDQANADDPIGVLVQHMTTLATPCTFNAGTGVMTVTVAAGETAIIARRATDSVIVQNGVPCATPGTFATVKQVAITGSSGDETIIVDYSNGVFATGSTSATSGVTVNMGGSAGGDVFGVRGTIAADTITMGASGIAVNTDATKDISFLPALTPNEPDSYTISLSDGADTFSAGGGTTLGVGTTYVGAKAIEVFGGAGNDTFAQSAAITKKEKIHGGSGTDTVSYALRGSSAPVTVTVGATANDGDNGGTELDDINSDVEVLTGGDGNDTLTAATGVAITLNGGKGNDALTGDSAADTINGDAGDDTIAGKAGNDTLNGNDGDDLFTEDTDANGGDVFNGGLGTDTVSYAARNAGVTVTMDGATALDGKTGAGENDNVKSDVENLIGSGFADAITGNASANVLTGGLGDDALTGGDGDDRFPQGTDPAASALDSDTIVGGNGVDEVDYSARTADLDITLDNVADSGDLSLTTPEHDKLDVEDVTCGAGDDTIIGNNGVNALSGGAGADDITGLDGDDILDGGTGTNTLDCGPGDGDIGFNGTKTFCEF